MLVATDIAARGIDIDELSHVFNFDLPNVPETYVHRIGRTGRAGSDGIAYSFCDHEEKEFLRDIQKLIRKSIPVNENHPFLSAGRNSSMSEERRPFQSGSLRRPEIRRTSNPAFTTKREPHRIVKRTVSSN